MTLEQQYLRRRVRHAPISARSVPLTDFCSEVLAMLDVHPAEHLVSVNGHAVRVLTTEPTT